MQCRTVARFDIPDIVRRAVDDELVSDTFHRLPRLHHRHGEPVELQVLLQIAHLVGVHRVRQGLGRLCRKRDALLLCELQHGGGTETAVEMHVQLCLGEAVKQFPGEGHGVDVPRRPRPAPRTTRMMVPGATEPAGFTRRPTPSVTYADSSATAAPSSGSNSATASRIVPPGGTGVGRSLTNTVTHPLTFDPGERPRLARLPPPPVE